MYLCCMVFRGGGYPECVHPCCRNSSIGGSISAHSVDCSWPQCLLQPSSARGQRAPAGEVGLFKADHCLSNVSQKVEEQFMCFTWKQQNNLSHFGEECLCASKQYSGTQKPAPETPNVFCCSSKDFSEFSGSPKVKVRGDTQILRILPPERKGFMSFWKH